MSRVTLQFVNFLLFAFHKHKSRSIEHKAEGKLLVTSQQTYHWIIICQTFAESFMTISTNWIRKTSKEEKQTVKLNRKSGNCKLIAAAGIDV